MGERQFETCVIHVCCNNSKHLPSELIPSHHQCRGYIHTYMCVHDFETDDCGTVRGRNIHKIIILMEVKTQEQVLKLFSACVVIISIQRNEQNTRFKH